MSSQVQMSTCKALFIQNSELIKCKESTNSNYCETHTHKYRLEKPDDCPVCMELISSETETPLECGHWIHKQCLRQSNKINCPMCRNKMNQKEIIYIFGTNDNNYDVIINNYNNIYMNEMSLIMQMFYDRDLYMNNIINFEDISRYSEYFERIILSIANTLLIDDQDDIDFLSEQIIRNNILKDIIRTSFNIINYYLDDEFNSSLIVHVISCLLAFSRTILN